jgi:hypothetical protein
MAELLVAAAQLETLVLLVALFGIVPGFVVRLLSWFFPAGDDRRREMVGELRCVPTWHRPIWAAQQLEVALFEGIPARWAARRAPSRRDGKKARARLGHATPPRRPRAALLPVILLAAAGSAFGGLVALPPASPGAALAQNAATHEAVNLAHVALISGVATAAGVGLGLAALCLVATRSGMTGYWHPRRR